MQPKPPTRKSLWNTPISELNIQFPDLGFLVKPALTGVGIFLIIFFGYRLFKGIGEMLTPVTIVSAEGNNLVTTSGISGGTLFVAMLIPLIFIAWRPIRRLLRDIGD